MKIMQGSFWGAYQGYFRVEHKTSLDVFMQRVTTMHYEKGR